MTHTSGTDELALSVVIPARDAAPTILSQLRALVSSPVALDLEILVVDDCSSDETPAIVAELSRADRRVRLVGSGAARSRGPACSRNLGIEAASHEQIALCDADDEVDPGWVEAMARALRDHDYVAGALDVEALNPEWIRGSRGASASMTQRPCFGGAFPFAHGCNVGVTRRAWRAAGGFNEALLHGDDVDFGLRMWCAGIPLHFEPRARVRYRYRTTLRSIARQSYSYGRSWPATCRLMSQNGLDPPSRAVGLRRILWLLRHVPALRHRAGRARWVWVLSNEAGRVRGSIRQRAVYV